MAKKANPAKLEDSLGAHLTKVRRLLEKRGFKDVVILATAKSVGGFFSSISQQDRAELLGKLEMVKHGIAAESHTHNYNISLQS